MIGILKFIFLIFIATAVIVGFGLFKLMNKMRDAAQRFGQNDYDRTRRNRNQRRQTRDDVTDTRSRRESDKKIFGKDEGEYVDFTEEK